MNLETAKHGKSAVFCHTYKSIKTSERQTYKGLDVCHAQLAMDHVSAPCQTDATGARAQGNDCCSARSLLIQHLKSSEACRCTVLGAGASK